MAELTVPSKKRRALAEMLMSQQGPAPQMVGNQMAYSPEAGLLSGLAKGIGGYLSGKEMKAAEDQQKLRRDELSRLLGGSQVSGGAPASPENASPSAPQAVRPASSTDWRQAISAALIRGDDEGAQQYASYAKLFASEAPEYSEPKNFLDPKTGKVFGGRMSKSSTDVQRLPFAVYQPQSEIYDPMTGNLIKTGGLPLEQVEGYTPPAPVAPQAAPEPTPVPGKVTKVIPGETPQARKAREDAEARRRAEARDEERLRLAREQSEAQIREKEAKRLAPVRDNNASIAKIDDAIAEIDRYPKGLGAQNMGGDGISQRLDPNGVSVRNKVSNIGSLQIKDRSGAAVSAAEMKRLGFLPLVTDTPEAARKKLQDLKAWIELENGYIGGQPSASAKVGKLRIE